MTLSSSPLMHLTLNLPQLGLSDWWIEIVTAGPACVYYFGPFADALEANDNVPGYMDDLLAEGARCTRVQVKRCQPTNLTVFN